MDEPDWTTCTEEQLWRYVAWHLEGAGIRSVLVGGAVVAIHTEGLYRSGDLDMVPDDLGRGRLPEVLARLAPDDPDAMPSLSLVQVRARIL